jgi:glycosyltransferase involved in cell wall biosynthesis
MHLHWAELQIAAGAARARMLRFASFMAALIVAKAAGRPVIYTVHNLAQHEGRHAGYNRLAHRALFAWAEALHAHDASVAEAIRRQTGRTRGVHVIPHGSYVGCYPDTVAPAEARRRLGLDETDFVYLALGGLRPYKGMEELIDAFIGLPEADARLVIAGHPHEPAYADALRARVAGDRRIVAHLEHVPDDDLQVYMRSADICLFPYRQATTSGAALLALSFGRPILAPALGPFPDLAAQTAGVTYDPTEAEGLRGALRRARQMDREAAGRAIATYIEGVSWPRIGAQHAAVYRALGRP